MKILVVDDDLVARKVIQNALEQLGYEVVAVEDGRRAWEILQAEEIRMVISDWMMPGIDGLALCRTIREHPGSGYVFFILLTSLDDKDKLIEGLEAGADDYLTKPFNHAELRARLNTGRRILDLEASLQQANEEIRRLSLTDALTGCYNKRYLKDQLPKEIRRARRYGHALSTVMCDLDHFKQINDRLGHLAGDRVLEETGRRLRGSIRSGIDWVARYGGEEFLLILPETEAEKAATVAERLRRLIAEVPFQAGDDTVETTASFGVAGFDRLAPDAAVTVEDLVRQADRLLYRSKEGGRNRVSWGALEPDAAPGDDPD